MNKFLETTYISEIIEESNKQPVIIFKYSKECGSSDRLAEELEKNIEKKVITVPIYKITVQTHKVLSEKIAELFMVKHETPQILVLNKGKLTYTAHHRGIKIENFVFQ